MRYLIVGYGNVGHKRHAALGKKCVATVDPDPKQKANFRDSSEVPDRITNKIDVVNIAVPKQPKLDLVRFWLEKGKHVVVEKPLVMTPAQAKALARIARKNKAIWYTAYNHRFEPNIARIKQIIDQGSLGKLYHAKVEYSFGNIRELLGTWRETGYGTLDETGCHLIDLANYFFGYGKRDFTNIIARKVESSTFDYCIFGTKDKKVLMEASWVTWKNVFKIEIYGERGSLHMNGLCKWGESELLIRKRVLPAGVPFEKRIVERGPDPTWKKDIAYFELLITRSKTSFETDILSNEALCSIVHGIDPRLSSNKIYEKLRGLKK